MEELGKRWIKNDCEFCKLCQVNSCEDRDIVTLSYIVCLQ